MRINTENLAITTNADGKKVTTIDGCDVLNDDDTTIIDAMIQLDVNEGDVLRFLYKSVSFIRTGDGACKRYNN